MTYRLRDQEPGCHHIVCRGNNKRDIYRSARDRQWFLVLLGSTAKLLGWSIHAYALMRNHYHLMVRTEEPNLAIGMCRLNTGYATWFNLETERINHLFGRRYWSEQLEDEARYFAALRYVVRNPTRAGIPGPLTSHVWTSYPASLGLDRPPIRIAREEVLGMFDDRPAEAVAAYRAFCEHPDGPEYVRSAMSGIRVSPSPMSSGSLRHGSVTNLSRERDGERRGRAVR
jgi:REP element-mobilizing transposase RayT